MFFYPWYPALMLAVESNNVMSTSGGKDDNMDGGRDKMPESNMAVKPAPGKI